MLMSRTVPKYLKQLLNSNLINSCTLQGDFCKKLEGCTNALGSCRFGINVLQDIVTVHFPSTYSSPYEKLTKEQVDFVLQKFQEQMIKRIHILLNGCDVALITELSAERYESGTVSDMALAILNEQQIGNVSQMTVIQPDAAFDIDSVHHIRKLLNVTKRKPGADKDYCLIMKCESGNASAFGYADRKEIAKKFPVINFIGHMSWTIELPPKFDDDGIPHDTQFEKWYDLPYENRCVARYKKGRILLPDLGDDSNDIRTTLTSKLCLHFDESKVGAILDLIIAICRQAKKQHKGTSVIFLPSDLAEKEAVRLYGFNRAYGLGDKLFDSTENTLLNLSSLDGTNFINYESGKYIAFGVLLDGRANIKCDLSRGARHASVLTHLNGCISEYPALAFVLSEDGDSKLYIKCYEKSVERIL